MTPGSTENISVPANPLQDYLSHHPLHTDALCILAGLLFPLAFAPLALWPLAVLALGILYSAWWVSGSRRAFWRGYLFGVASFGSGIYWLHISFSYSHVVLPVAVVLTGLFVLFMALYPGLLGWLVVRLPRTRQAAWFLLWLPATWVLQEWLRGWFLSGFPWLQAGYSQSGAPAMSLAPWTGVLGMSWWVALLGAGLALLLVSHGRAWRPVLAAVLLLTLLTPLAGLPEFTRAQGEPRQVALIQGNVAQDVKWLPAWRKPTLERYLSLSAPYWGKDLIIWPETAIPAFRNQVESFLQALQSRATAEGSDLLIGLPVRGPDPSIYYNSVIAVGRQPGRYDKRHLVPFGEFLPLKGLLGPVVDFLRIPLSDFTPGAIQQAPLRVAGDKVALSICYEGVLGSLLREDARDADVLVNVSNDAWFGESIAAEQHLQMSRLRAAETGRYLLRATNTGISAIIDPAGRLLARSTRFRAEVLAGSYQPMHGRTPYMLLGDWLAVLSCLALAGLGWWRQKT